ncbi:hypothetical protein CLOP_g16849, partial [Closterium sp. NIES-67]
LWRCRGGGAREGSTAAGSKGRAWVEGPAHKLTRWHLEEAAAAAEADAAAAAAAAEADAAAEAAVGGAW